MPSEKCYEFLEHTADVYVAAYGASLEEAFENAALATFDVMTDVDKVEPKVEESIEVTAPDEYALLYNWLEELLVKSEVNEHVYSRFEIPDIEKRDTGLRLKAKIGGESFDPHKHPQKIGIKAVTYHRMEIVKKPKRITVKFILDV